MSATGDFSTFARSKQRIWTTLPGAVVAGSVFQLVLPVVSSVLLALCFPPFDLWWLAWVALVPLAVSVAVSDRVLEPAVGALVGGAIFHLLALDFVRTSLRGPDSSAPWAFAWLATGLAASPTWLLAVLTVRLVFYRIGRPMCLALPVGWIVGDLARRCIAVQLTETDFPWLQLAATQTHWPAVVQIADVLGGTGVSALVASGNALLIDLFLCSGRQKRSVISLGTAILALVLAYGTWRLSQADARTGPTVCLMPGDRPPGSIVDAPTLRGTADIFLWPEGTIEDDSPTGDDSIMEIERFAKATGSLVAIGWYRTSPKFAANSMALAEPARGLVAVYDKTHLVPWAEFTPRIEIPYLPRSRKPIHAGTDNPTFTWAGTCIAPGICYDVCFPSFLRQSSSAEIILVSSLERVDETKRLPEQVLQLVRLRATEFRRPIVRNVIRGHSGVIDGCGRVLADIVDLDEPTVVGPVPIDSRFSLYAKTGDTILIVPFALVGATCLHRRWRRARPVLGSGDQATP